MHHIFHTVLFRKKKFKFLNDQQQNKIPGMFIVPFIVKNFQSFIVKNFPFFPPFFLPIYSLFLSFFYFLFSLPLFFFSHLYNLKTFPNDLNPHPLLDVGNTEQ